MAPCGRGQPRLSGRPSWQPRIDRMRPSSAIGRPSRCQRECREFKSHRPLPRLLATCVARRRLSLTTPPRGKRYETPAARGLFCQSLPSATSDDMPGLPYGTKLVTGEHRVGHRHAAVTSHRPVWPKLPEPTGTQDLGAVLGPRQLCREMGGSLVAEHAAPWPYHRPRPPAGDGRA